LKKKKQKSERGGKNWKGKVREGKGNENGIGNDGDEE
jgi:hypothetical protein